MVGKEIKIGKVITFYSYKGGVGRSMGMANIAAIIAKWGYKTLVIDWDLEAPGLENYYAELIDANAAKNKKGLIDLLDLKVNNPEMAIEKIRWNDYYTKVPLEENFHLDLMTAGKRDEDYVKKVRSFDYASFYEDADGGQFIEDLREHWIQEYDYILIDSRTGLTDSSGICSIHMPDILVLMFTPNEQSFNGVKVVSKKAKEGQKELLYDRFQLRTLPVVSRIENAETTLLDDWLNRIAAESTEMLDWLPINTETKAQLISPMQLINHTKIPYKAFYAYGETLPVQTRGTADPLDIGYVYETLAALLINNLESMLLLNDSRDNYIKKAKGQYIEEQKLQEKISENEALNSSLTEQLKDKESAHSKMVYERNRNRKIIGVIAVVVTILISFFSYRSFVSSKTQEIKADSLNVVVETIEYKSKADSLAQVNDSVKADQYYVEAANAALSIRDTTKAISILKDASKRPTMSTSTSSRQLDNLLRSKHDNVFKVDVFYRDDSGTNTANAPSKILNPSDIATLTVNSVATIENVVGSVRSISDEKQKHYRYTGYDNEVRYENDEEKLAVQIVNQLNALPNFQKNNITFKAVRMENSASYHYISVFIRNRIESRTYEIQSKK
jgi:MinD-like ATPase involved in chromosome partitioning or flagellar assembly